MKIFCIISFLLVGTGAISQVKVNKPIVLTGSDPAQRQVQGLPAANTPDAVITAETELSNQHRFAEPAAGVLWQIDALGIDQAPIPGTHFLVKSPAPTAGPIQVMINAHGPYELTFGATDLVDGNSIPAGTMISIVFDGNGFQLINGEGGSLRNCPEGMVAVNDQFCIQIERSVQMEFWDAIESCGSQSLRLCSWGEYYAACTNAEVLGLANIPSAWEWTNSTANEDANVRIAGSSNCQSASTGTATTGNPEAAQYFRCCFTR